MRAGESDFGFFQFMLLFQIFVLCKCQFLVGRIAGLVIFLEKIIKLLKNVTAPANNPLDLAIPHKKVNFGPVVPHQARKNRDGLCYSD